MTKQKADDASIMAELNASVKEDHRLYKEDIIASQAHAAMLAQCGIISHDDCDKICVGLDRIKDEIATGAFDLDPRLEDIHMNVEARLHELIGAVAGKLHTARSRNDQVATDVRMWLRGSCDRLDDALRALVTALCDRGLQNLATVMPGYTHLQVAQPVSFAFHLASYVEAFSRDRHRLAGCRWRLNASPLGSAALAGTPHPIDRLMTAKSLGFNRVMGNAMDGVSSRDHIQEYCAGLTIIATNLSRLAQDLFLWSNQGFGFVSFPDVYSSRSSIMPQKQNPDAAELIRGRSAAPLSAFVAITHIIKALPQAYNKDLQEDKKVFLTAFDTVLLSLAAMSGCVSGLRLHENAMKRALEKGYPTATDLADWMVERGTPFREAYQKVQRLVAKAQEIDCGLADMPREDLAAIDSDLPEAAPRVLDTLAAMQRRTSYGGTAEIVVGPRLQKMQAWARLDLLSFVKEYEKDMNIDGESHD